MIRIQWQSLLTGHRGNGDWLPDWDAHHDLMADLNREFVDPIRIGDPSLAAIPITGVIVLDTPRAVTDRLSLMLPVKTVGSAQGLMLLRK